jgi:hypothetical protein
MATADQLRELRNAAPFRPFVVKMADGREFTVEHPELVACDRAGRSMSLYDDDGLHLLEMLLIAEMRPAARPATARRKGGARP